MNQHGAVVPPSRPVVRAATHREVVSGHWWYEDDSPHITLEVFPQPDKGRKSLRSGSKISPDSGRRSVSGLELQARLVKTVKIQCWVAKLAWTRPSVAALVRVCAIR